MSSILKALKKLETESPDSVDLRSLPVVRRPSKSQRHRVPRNRVFYISLITLSIATVLAGSIWFIFDRSSREITLPVPATLDKDRSSTNPTQKERAGIQVARHSESPMKAEIKDAKSVAVLENTTMSSDSPRKDEVVAFTEKQPKQMTQTRATSAPYKSPLTEKQLQVAVKKDTPVETSFAPSNESAPARTDEQKNSYSRSYEEGDASSEPLDPFATIPEKSEDDSGLKLQAIAWSEDPQQRMAVINSNIVREGGSVEGSSVTHIGEDLVVFTKDGEEWKQLFRLR